MDSQNNPLLQLNEAMTLRDKLAVDRTVLANERTMLAYVRTALGFLVLGLSFLHFLEQLYFHVTGYAFMAVAAFVLVVGMQRFVRLGRAMAALQRKSSELPTA